MPEMFWTIYRHRVPGRLEVRREEIVKTIFVADGTVVHAASSERSDRLGAYLYRKGRLSREDLTRTMAERDTSTKRHGQLLVEHGLLSPAELNRAIREQMESIVWSVFSWRAGEVMFSIGSFLDPQRVRIHLPVREAILRGVKTMHDAKSLIGRLGKKSTVLRPSYATEDLIEISLSAEEFELLRMIDGRRSLFEVCTDGPFATAENARLVYAFYVLHLVERSDGKPGLKIRLSSDASSPTSDTTVTADAAPASAAAI